MYNEHFGLKGAPFKITPDPRLFYAGGKRGEVLQALVYAITSGEGIIKVVGEVGVGKTMLCRMLEVKLPGNVETVYLANPSLSPEDILQAIGLEMGLEIAEQENRLKTLQRIQEHLVAKHARNEHVVVLVEEAQSMPNATLEEIRLLSNLETGQNKLLQIVLFGQPELNDKLSDPSIRQLRERITHSFTLEPFNPEEVREYVDFRLRQMGYRGRDAFQQGAYRRIAKASMGLTRRVNILADKALLAAYADDTHDVSKRHVGIAIQDSEYIKRLRLRWPELVLITGAVMLVIALATFWWLRGGLGFGSADENASPASPAASLDRPASQNAAPVSADTGADTGPVVSQPQPARIESTQAPALPVVDESVKVRTDRLTLSASLNETGLKRAESASASSEARPASDGDSAQPAATAAGAAAAASAESEGETGALPSAESASPPSGPVAAQVTATVGQAAGAAQALAKPATDAVAGSNVLAARTARERAAAAPATATTGGVGSQSSAPAPVARQESTLGALAGGQSAEAAPAAGAATVPVSPAPASTERTAAASADGAPGRESQAPAEAGSSPKPAVNAPAAQPATATAAATPESSAPAQPSAQAGPAQVAVTPEPSVTNSTLPAAAESADLVAQRLQATRAWLNSIDGSYYSIQLLLTHVSRREDLEAFLRGRAQAGELDHVYVYETVINRRTWFGVLYRSYPTFSEARRALRTLPSELSLHEPFIRNVRDISVLG